ncbi:MAG: hypothetical protein WC939_04005 [Acholeplasmataceae bacterium]
MIEKNSQDYFNVKLSSRSGILLSGKYKREVLGAGSYPIGPLLYYMLSINKDILNNIRSQALNTFVNSFFTKLTNIRREWEKGSPEKYTVDQVVNNLFNKYLDHKELLDIYMFLHNKYSIVLSIVYDFEPLSITQGEISEKTMDSLGTTIDGLSGVLRMLLLELKKILNLLTKHENNPDLYKIIKLLTQSGKLYYSTLEEIKKNITSLINDIPDYINVFLEDDNNGNGGNGGNGVKKVKSGHVVQREDWFPFTVSVPTPNLSPGVCRGEIAKMFLNLSWLYCNERISSISGVAQGELGKLRVYTTPEEFLTAYYDVLYKESSSEFTQTPEHIFNLYNANPFLGLSASEISNLSIPLQKKYKDLRNAKNKV